MDKQELKNKLTEEEYRVTQEKATEAPFTGVYVNEHSKGKYACKVCGTELFSSDSKFDSGTGWPSFDQAISGSVKMETDTSHGMIRTEVTCAKCGAHLGHVFDDGPKETTCKRFCINSASLDLNKEL
ncbi:MAG: peptide-methionine (R)-S-oxide reductase MsrB [Candidatus Pacebacteria bacterium]|nr:peptide-methionine (R)-S-oxide reductase MsrB [Candidatus Paceibacterota bacterium]